MRGDIYELKSIRGTKGREQSGPRYGVVVQSDDLPLSTCLVAPTSTGRRESSFRPVIDIGGESTVVLVEQTMGVDVEVSLGAMVGRVTLAQMQSINEALRLVLSLD